MCSIHMERSDQSYLKMNKLHGFTVNETFNHIVVVNFVCNLFYFC